MRYSKLYFPYSFSKCLVFSIYSLTVSSEEQVLCVFQAAIMQICRAFTEQKQHYKVLQRWSYSLYTHVECEDTFCQTGSCFRQWFLLFQALLLLCKLEEPKLKTVRTVSMKIQELYNRNLFLCGHLAEQYLLNLNNHLKGWELWKSWLYMKSECLTRCLASELSFRINMYFFFYTT